MRFFKVFLQSVHSSILNILYPPVCPICREPVEEAHCLCPDCYARLHVITAPCCRICGRPFEYAPLGEILCARCLKKKPPFSMARSVLAYDDFSKQLVLAFKHGDSPELAQLLTKFLCQADPAIFRDIDWVIPVPLHWTRRLKRTYNQVGLLAKALAQVKGLSFRPNMLVRVRATSEQGHKTRTQREKNIRHAFQVRYPDRMKGKRILVIDDVMASGATVTECARTLRRAGAKEVRILTVYRSLK